MVGCVVLEERQSPQVNNYNTYPGNSQTNNLQHIYIDVLACPSQSQSPIEISSNVMIVGPVCRRGDYLAKASLGHNQLVGVRIRWERLRRETRTAEVWSSEPFESRKSWEEEQ